MFKRPSIFLLVLIVPTAIALAQTGLAPVKEHQVVTARFLPESSKDAVYRVRVIDRQEIDDLAASTLADLMAYDLSVTTEHHRVFGSGLSIGGLAAEQMKILLDGVPVVGRLDGQIDLYQIRLDHAARIEIIEGPVSVYYGTDALGGVVNVITQPPDNRPLNGHLRSDFDSNQGWRHGLQVAQGVGTASLSAFGALENSDDHTSHPETRQATWPERNQRQAGLAMDMPVNRFVVGFRGQFFDEDLTDRGNFDGDSASDTRYQTRRHHVSTQLQGFINSAWHLDAQAADSNYRRHYDRWTVSADSPNRSTETAHNQDPVRYRHQFARVLQTFGEDQGQVQIGAEWSSDTSRGNRIFQGEQTMEERAVFTTFRWEPLRGLTVQPALRWMDHSHYDAPLTPAINLLYQGSWTFRGDYSRGFRGPGLKELFLDFQMAAGPLLYVISGNTELVPEEADNTHLSMQRTWRNQDAQFQFEAQAFLNEVDQLIALSDLQPVPESTNRFERHYLNILSHRSHGAGFKFQSTVDDWQWQAGIHWNATNNRLSAESLSDTLHRIDGGAGLVWQPLSSPWRCSLSAKHTGRQSGVAEVGRGADRALEETRIPSFTLVDVNLQWSFPNRSLSLRAGVHNLLDVEARGLTGLSGSVHESNQIDPGRSWQLGFRWQWQ